MRTILLGALALLFTVTTQAQGKVGTIDSDYIVTVMPEFVTMQKDLKAYNADLEGQMQEKVKIYQERVKDFQANGATLPAATAQLKKDQIIAAEQDIAKFRQNGSQLLELKRNELMRPLYERIGKALDEVAKAEGYTQVMNSNGGVVYSDPAYDITVAVMLKLGIEKAGN